MATGKLVIRIDRLSAENIRGVNPPDFYFAGYASARCPVLNFWRQWLNKKSPFKVAKVQQTALAFGQTPDKCDMSLSVIELASVVFIR
jgi:hypothetical protein